jgi:hypothetical protein
MIHEIMMPQWLSASLVIEMAVFQSLLWHLEKSQIPPDPQCQQYGYDASTMTMTGLPLPGQNEQFLKCFIA